jgi:hypothetical protein
MFQDARHPGCTTSRIAPHASGHAEDGALDSGFDPYKQPAAAGVFGSGPPASDPEAGALLGHKRQRMPLSSVMTLLPEYFPDELYSIKDKRCVSRGEPGAQPLQTACSRVSAPRAQWRGHPTAAAGSPFWGCLKSAGRPEDAVAPPAVPRRASRLQTQRGQDAYFRAQGAAADDPDGACR